MKDRFEIPAGEHDWHSREYVDHWIEHDVTRDDERRPVLSRMLSVAPFARDAEIRVLDIGAGYGILSEEVLKTFPRARVTLQDYSEPMAEHARKRLAAYANAVSYLMVDFSDPAWGTKVGGPFDLAVSALALHNLDFESPIKRSYRSVHAILRPEGLFLDYDLFGLVPGGVNAHRSWLREAGFKRVEILWEQMPLATVAAWMS